jgi:2-isopropylmalate synthase
MGMNTRKDFFDKKTKIKTEFLYETSRMVSRLTGIIVQPNKAVVGSNAFAHEAGIHQDGILKKRTTYEIMKPQDVGFGETKLVLGKHSGRHALSIRLKKLGYSLSEAGLRQVFERFKRLADKKKLIYDEDLKAIVEDGITATIPELYQLEYLHIEGGTQEIPTANVRLKVKNRIAEASATGDGPVDACYKAVDKITGLHGILLDYGIRSITSGKDALGEASIKVNIKGRVVSGKGTSTDIIEASVKAYLNVMNKISWSIPAKIMQRT